MTDQAIADAREDRFLRAIPDHRMTAVTGPDWTGFPIRVSRCLTRGRALELLDWPAEQGELGGRALQEEYVEWRVVREGEAIRRVEFTSELPDYWGILAAYEPGSALELVARFADESSIDPQALYGDCDPFSRTATPTGRMQGFLSTALTSSYNGARGLFCMAQRSNTLEALMRLAALATSVRLLQDPPGGRFRCLTCSETIPLLCGAAQLGRASDPVLVERLGRIAYEGRLVAFDDPLGVYLQDVEHARLETPSGEIVPRDWFRFDRGAGPGQSADGRARYQRMVFEVPPKEGFAVSDLIDLATEQPIRYGGQIADLVQLRVFFSVSEPGLVAVDHSTAVELAGETLDPAGCAKVSAQEQQYRAARDAQ